MSMIVNFLSQSSHRYIPSTSSPLSSFRWCQYSEGSPPSSCQHEPWQLYVKIQIQLQLTLSDTTLHSDVLNHLECNCEQWMTKPQWGRHDWTALCDCIRLESDVVAHMTGTEGGGRISRPGSPDVTRSIQLYRSTATVHNTVVFDWNDNKPLCVDLLSPNYLNTQNWNNVGSTAIIFRIWFAQYTEI